LYKALGGAQQLHHRVELPGGDGSSPFLRFEETAPSAGVALVTLTPALSGAAGAAATVPLPDASAFSPSSLLRPLPKTSEILALIRRLLLLAAATSSELSFGFNSPL